MGRYLGIDTSNYTTSTALYDTDTGELRQCKQPLTVREGQVGLRQSDAVFCHVKALGGLLEQLMKDAANPSAIGFSATPRDEAGSYMPCFLAGEMAARSAASVSGIDAYSFSHQAGHIAAALFGAERMELLEREFLAFHVSGGTTQCLQVSPDSKKVFRIETVARSLDLHAGQVVDRVGATLGLRFPAGPALEELAMHSSAEYRPKPSMKGLDCCLSGLENQCADRLGAGESPEDVAKYCLCALREVLLAMTGGVLKEYPGLPVVYAGGVMSNRLLQQAMANAFHGSFAPPAFSADNAAGIAILTAIRHDKEGVPCSR